MTKVSENAKPKTVIPVYNLFLHKLRKNKFTFEILILSD